MGGGLKQCRSDPRVPRCAETPLISGAYGRFGPQSGFPQFWIFGDDAAGWPETLGLTRSVCLIYPSSPSVCTSAVRPDSSVQWSSYPALLIAGALAVGITVDASLEPSAISGWLTAGVVSVVSLLGIERMPRTQIVTVAPLGRVLVVVLLAMACGGARHALYDEPSARPLVRLAEAVEDDAELRGLVADAPERTREATRFTLRVDSFIAATDTVRIEGRARVTLRVSPWIETASTFPAVREGDILEVRGSLERPPGLRNPGGFDYRAYLDRRGVCCALYVGQPRNVAVQGDRRGPVTSAVVWTREYVREHIDGYVPSAGGRAVLRALLLADRSRISDAQRDQFVKTGLMHLLAVSGLHVFLVGMVLYVLLRPLLARLQLSRAAVEGARATLTIAVLVFYMLLTGARPSVVRAVVMAALFIGGILFQRSAHSLNTLGVAAVILLLLRPTALFDVGFQLSMGAVGAIVTLNPRLVEAVPEALRGPNSAGWLLTSVTTSAAAILGTAPVLLYHFGWVSVAGLVLNVAGIPCTALALTGVLLALLCGGMWELAGSAFGSAADLFVQSLLATSRYGAEWFAWAGLRMPVPEPWAIGALIAALLAVAQWPRPRNRWRWVALGMAFAVVSVWGGAVGRGAKPTLDMVFFDVGQGDAVLVSTPSDQHMLVDTGPYSPDGSAARYVILPYLERRGIDYLGTVVVTHPDEDHLGGLPEILREVSVGRVIRSGRAADTELYRRTQRLIARTGVPEVVARRGDTLRVSEAVRAQVLGPPANASKWGIDSRNGMSVVLHVAYGAVDALLPGDVERTAEGNLVGTYGEQLHSRLVKVPHHGSSTSSTKPFVKSIAGRVKAGLAVVSVGREEQYGMPSGRVLARWEASGLRVRNTASSGAVWVRTNGRGVWTVDWR